MQPHEGLAIYKNRIVLEPRRRGRGRENVSGIISRRRTLSSFYIAGKGKVQDSRTSV